MKYLRFQLLISAGPPGGYTVHALTPRGEGRARFNLPFPPAEAAAAWRRIARAGRELGSPHPASELSPDALGEKLFRALFQEEVLRLYERSLDLLEADHPEVGLRLELMLDPRDADLAALEMLPWELLRQPDTPEFLALLRRRPIVRYLMMARPVYAAPRPATIRILAVAANPRLLPQLDLAHELADLRQAVGSAAGLEVFTPAAPTLAALRQSLRDRECHVLHFMGHGGSAADAAKKVLFFETEHGGASPVRGTDLANKLADFPSLRLVVLNACQSAAVPVEVSEDEPEAFAGVASSLVLGGMPAVVAMQFPISDPAAIAFSRAFYQRLAAGDPVDAAVAEARQEMHSKDPASSEWATPVLFMRTWTGELFPAKNVWDPAAWKERARRLTLAILVFLLLGGAALAARTWKVEQLVTEGAALYEHGEWPAARERFRAALRLAPGSAEVLSDLAGSEEKLGDVQEAEEHYREAARRQPDSAEHLYNLGHFLNSRKRYDEAYRVLSQAIARDPQRADAYGELAQAAGGRGMLAKARMILGVALRLDSERPALYRRLGELELSAGRPKAALPYLDEARRRYPLGDLERVETIWLSVQAYDQLGDVPSLCREIREFHRLDPTGVTPWVLKTDEIAARRSCQQEP